ncbi:MAG: PPE domain-containing protein, partial [Mycobacterium sp.]|uniref:PPE domain-containing protein n=1 Tax=Mycobacterium sp. TaxID=1785 RepID=UPI003C500578
MSDLGALPPEVSSALIYSGPGSSSLMSAAAAWNAVAAELASTAQGLDKVVSQLASESWLGPTSAAMVAAVQPYVSWVSTTAGQAEHAAAQAQSAAAAFETV